MSKRTNNFTSQEVNTLLDLVEAKKNILENKKTGRVTVEEKKNAWKEIAKDFNITFVDCIRFEKVLITKYQNIKRVAKSDFAFDRRQSYKTGGGPIPPSAVTEKDKRIVAICQAEQLGGCKAFYDDDNRNLVQSMLNSIVDEEAKEQDAVEAVDAAETVKAVEGVEDVWKTVLETEKVTESVSNGNPAFECIQLYLSISLGV